MATLTELRDGLVHVAPAGAQALMASPLLFKIHDSEPATLDLAASVDLTGLKLSQVIDRGYVAMVHANSGMFRFSRSPISVAESAGPTGGFAIIGGAEWILSTARAINATVGPKLVAPLAVGVVALTAYLIFR